MVASLKFAVDNISYGMFLLLLGLLVPVKSGKKSGTIDGLGDIHVGRTCIVLVVLSSAAWLLALLRLAIIIAHKLTQKDANELTDCSLTGFLASQTGFVMGLTSMSLVLYWVWTRLIAPSVEDAPKPADIECAALVWQIALLVMELQDVAAVLLKQHGLSRLTWRGRLKSGLAAHFASGWNWIEAMAFACMLVALVWRQCIFRSSDQGQSLADHPGVNEFLTVGILMSWVRVLRAMEVSSRIGPLLSMVSPLPSSRCPSAPHRC
jgi:hypothetical protein